MTTFDKREEGFEKKFALDEEQKFKAMARRNRLLGLWAAEKLGLSGDAATAYSKEVVAADFEEAGDDDVQNKVVKDFAAKGVAITAAGGSRQDERAAGAGRRPGEGGDVRAAVPAPRHSGACEARTTVRNCAPENLEIPGLVLRTIPEGR